MASKFGPSTGTSDIQMNEKQQECVITNPLVIILCISRYNVPFSDLPSIQKDKEQLKKTWYLFKYLSSFYIKTKK